MTSKSGTMFQNYREEAECVPLLTSKDHKLQATFQITPTTTTIANTLRRQILIATPTLGFKTEPALDSDIKITKNTTPIPNEMIAHRISMIPIAGDPTTFDSERYIFQLNVTNETDSTMDITASDFSIIEKESPTAVDGIRRSTADFFPPDPITGETCLITRLRPQWNPTNPPESIVLTGKAKVGTGSMNIHWSAVSQCSYENTVDPDETRQKDIFERWVKESKKVEEGAEAGLMKRLRDEFDTMEVKRCFLVNELGEPNHFTFKIESKGIQSVPTIVMNGIYSCISLLRKYIDIDTMIPSSVKFEKSNTRYSGINCIFQDEGHTLGNLLQSYLTYNHIEGSKEPQIAYAGYKIPHPLRAELVITVALPPAEGDARPVETEIGIVRYAIAQVSRSLTNYFEEMAKDWNRTTGAPLRSKVGSIAAAPPAAAAATAATAATPPAAAAAPAARAAAPAPTPAAPAAAAARAAAPTPAAPAAAAPTPAAPAAAAPTPAAPTPAAAAPAPAAPAAAAPAAAAVPAKKASVKRTKETSVV
jgi:DNA-directed RNA polymerase subunit L